MPCNCQSPRCPECMPGFDPGYKLPQGSLRREGYESPDRPHIGPEFVYGEPLLSCSDCGSTVKVRSTHTIGFNDLGSGFSARVAMQFKRDGDSVPLCLDCAVKIVNTITGRVATEGL